MTPEASTLSTGVVRLRNGLFRSIDRQGGEPTLHLEVNHGVKVEDFAAEDASAYREGHIEIKRSIGLSFWREVATTVADVICRGERSRIQADFDTAITSIAGGI